MIPLILGFTQPSQPQFPRANKPKRAVWWSSENVPEGYARRELPPKVKKIYLHTGLDSLKKGLVSQFGGENIQRVSNLNDLCARLESDFGKGIAGSVRRYLQPVPGFTITNQTIANFTSRDTPQGCQWLSHGRKGC